MAGALPCTPHVRLVGQPVDAALPESQFAPPLLSLVPPNLPCCTAPAPQIQNEADACLRVQLAAGANQGYQFKTHPNIDKTAYKWVARWPWGNNFALTTISLYWSWGISIDSLARLDTARFYTAATTACWD
jgi:hypothetical protein